MRNEIWRLNWRPAKWGIGELLAEKISDLKRSLEPLDWNAVTRC